VENVCKGKGNHPKRYTMTAKKENDRCVHDFMEQFLLIVDIIP